MAHLRWHTSDGTPQKEHLRWHTSEGHTSDGTPQTVLLLNIHVFWDVTPCRLVNGAFFCVTQTLLKLLQPTNDTLVWNELYCATWAQSSSTGTSDLAQLQDGNQVLDFGVRIPDPVACQHLSMRNIKYCRNCERPIKRKCVQFNSQT